MISLEQAEQRLQAADFQGALKALSGKPPRVWRAQRDFLAAEALRGQGFFRSSERLYRRLWSRAVRREDPALWIDAGLALAACRRSLGGVREARRYLSAVRSLIGSARWRSFRPQLELEAALVERAAGRFGLSIAVLRRLLSRALLARRWAEAAFLLWAIGGALRFSGRLEESKRSFERSRALARRAKDRQGEAYALFGLGGVTRIQGELQASAGYYAQAGRQLAATQDLFGKAYAECGLANALRQLGRWPEAERHYLRSHKLYSSLEDQVDLAYVEWGLGKIHLGRGALPEAKRRLLRALQWFERHGETRGEVLAGVALAQALHASGKTDEAERRFAAAYALARKSGLHAHLELFT